MCLPNWVWIQIFQKYCLDVNINWYKNIHKWNQQNYNATSQFIVLSKRRAKKVTQNDYDKLALNAFHKLDYHIPHNMISTFSDYPFFFCGQDHWFLGTGLSEFFWTKIAILLFKACPKPTVGLATIKGLTKARTSS